jgi:LysR family transcriptional regulator, glycine cleavage system transcriptional activator
MAKIDLRKLPPLKALKGFEATMRRLSVRDAADELCLTHPAISHQIQLIEADLGVPLFSREGRKITPTSAGELLYPYVRRALESLIEGADLVRQVSSEQPLRVQTYVTASVRWLAQRIPGFVHEHPGLDVQLNTCAFEWDFDESMGDVGLVYCENPPGDDFCWVPLFDYTLFPVCTPALRARLAANPKPQDLLALPLVGVYTEARSWDIWFESAQVTCTSRPRTVADTLAVALEIALQGEAVALVNGPFADEDLRSGRLVRPVAHQLRCQGSWGLICRQEKRDTPRVRAFIDYIARSVAATPR